MTEHKINLAKLAKARDGSGHSIFSPSFSPAWLVCSGSLIPNILAEDDAGEEAAYGTVAHGLTEVQLKTGVAQTHRIGDVELIDTTEWHHTISIDEEMLSFVQQCVDYCEWLPGDHFVEQRVYFSEYTPIPNQSGTADHVACEPGLMTITDHKFGKGILVHAAENLKDPRPVIFNDVDGSFVINGNTQGLLYALGFFLKHDAKYDFQRIVIRIAQPRLGHFEEWETTRSHLLEFAEFVRVRAGAAWKIGAPRRPSDKGCQWCKVKADCAAYAVVLEELVSGVFEDLTQDISASAMTKLQDRLDDPIEPYSLEIVNTQRLTTAQMATLLPFRGVVEKFFAAIAQELLNRAKAGEKIPRYKLAETRSHRRFRNKDEAIAVLREAGVPMNAIITEELLSPADAEKALRKAGIRAKDLQSVLAPLVFKPPGNPTLVKDNDIRPALAPVDDGAFDDLIDADDDV